jgi:hypothetical protein
MSRPPLRNDNVLPPPNHLLACFEFPKKKSMPSSSHSRNLKTTTTHDRFAHWATSALTFPIQISSVIALWDPRCPSNFSICCRLFAPSLSRPSTRTSSPSGNACVVLVVRPSPATNFARILGSKLWFRRYSNQYAVLSLFAIVQSLAAPGTGLTICFRNYGDWCTVRIGEMSSRLFGRK